MGDQFQPARWGGGGKKSVQAVSSTPAMPAAIETEPEAPTYESGPDATDAAKALAAEHQIDLASVSGSGVDGRITKDDVATLVTASEEKTAEGTGEEMTAIEVPADGSEHTLEAD